MLVLNDIHLGVERKGGTTPASQEGLRTYLFGSTRSLLEESTETVLLVLGDLFNEFEIAPRDWIDTYLMLANWALRKQLILVAGNHDWSPKGTKVSAFEMLCRVLKQEYDESVQVISIDQWQHISVNDIALAHCSNQDTFDIKVGEVLEECRAGTRVFLHANYHNNFAVESDHSLNVSEEMAKRFASKGATLYFAHEHQARTALGGSVVVLGNQWPSSISDCLNNDFKYAHVIDGGVRKIETWSRDCDMGFNEVSWRDLDQHVTTAGFIRIVGDAGTHEAGDVTSAIARFRTKAKALVISNATKVDGIAQQESLPETFEVAKRFDVMSFILDSMDNDRQREAIHQLSKEAGQ